MTNKQDQEDEPYYPTDYDDAPEIEDGEKWLALRSASDVASDVEDLHRYQLEWLGYLADDMNKKAVIQAELHSRDYDDLDKDQTVFDRDGSLKKTSNNKSSTGRTSGGSVWDSGLEIVESFEDLAEQLIGARSLEQYAKEELGVEKNKVIVPEEVRKICVALQHEVNSDYGGKCEFGVLFKGEWTDEGFKVKPDYVVPEQKASRAHITYTEDLKSYRDEGYTVNIHSHPWAGKSSGFSGTDDDHINSHFDMAVLFAGGAETLVDAKANIETSEGFKVQIQPEVVVEEPEEELPEVDIENVETRKRRGRTGKSSSSTRRKHRRYHNYGHGHGYYGGWKGNSPNYSGDDESLPQSPEETDEEQQVMTSREL